MKPIEQARADLNAAKACDDDDFSKHIEKVLEAGTKLKKVMIQKSLQAARATCPNCGREGALHGRLVTGPAAGRHRKSGGALRMWCDTCPGIRMME